jgi:hypothetical protein
MKFTLVTSFYNGENFIELLYEKIKSHYVFFFQVDEHMTLTLLR